MHVGTDSVTHAGGEVLHEHATVAQPRAIDPENTNIGGAAMADPGINHVQQRFIGREADPVGTGEIIRDHARLPRTRVQPVNAPW